jgi:two-component system, NtrC family, response regulator HydG
VGGASTATSMPMSAHDESAPSNETPERTSSVKGNGRVLVVDDDQATCELISASLEKHGFEVDWHTRATDSLEAVKEEDFDLVLTDLLMDDMGGLELCERIVGTKPDLPVVLVTGHGTLEKAVSAIRVGAYDFITKPIDMKLLALTVSRGVQHHRLRDEVRRLRTAVEEARSFEKLIGRSSAMRRVYDLIERLAETDASVLITGESGTGKELVAKAIHERSSRKDGPFVALNCAAVPATLIESELFGHTKGAFTDAKGMREGLFTQADGGTLFLDEIGELPMEMQPKLLRALQERKVRPVGGNNEIPFDARIVAATNRDLEETIRRAQFREDLYYRINVVRVDVPPLRERGGDILLLAQHFVERFGARFGKDVGGIATPTAKKLMAYDWPGNVRELENCVERAVALTRFDHLTVEDLPENVRAYKASRFMMDAEDPQELLTITELEKRYIHRVLSMVDGNKSRAARILGLDRRTLYRKLERYAKEEP